MTPKQLHKQYIQRKKYLSKCGCNKKQIKRLIIYLVKLSNDMANSSINSKDVVSLIKEALKTESEYLKSLT